MASGGCSIAQNNVVNRDEHKLYDVSDKTHHDEAHCRCLENLGVFSFVGSSTLVEEVLAILCKLLELVDNALLLFCVFLGCHLDV